MLSRSLCRDRFGEIFEIIRLVDYNRSVCALCRGCATDHVTTTEPGETVPKLTNRNLGTSAGDQV